MININVIIPVYNDVSQLQNVIYALKNQEISSKNQVHITLINDGSSKETRGILETEIKPLINHLIHHPTNQGRAATRNTGHINQQDDILIFIDADCIPQGKCFIQSHINALQTSDVSCGRLIANSSQHPFWGRYQQIISKKRESDHQQGNNIAFTTANLAVHSNLFNQIDGFDERYRHYGFEDRDFLLRCQQQNSTITYTPRAAISHDDSLSLQSISRKMYEAGKFTAGIFSNDHPEAYHQMPYGKIDLRLNSILNFSWPLFNLVHSILKPTWIDRLLYNDRLPYSIKSKLVKITSALHFMAGTHAAQSKVQTSSKSTDSI